MKLLRKFLVLTHRYLGIALGLLVIMWFVSGIVMMYAGGMPSLTPQLRLDRLPPLDLSRTQLSVAEAASRAGLERPRQAVLFSLMERPAYRFAGAPAVTVFADTGEVFEEATLSQATAVASRFVGVSEDRLRFAETVRRVDQWTLTQSRQMPLHKFRVDDGAGTELYVSAQTGEVSMLTTRRSRALAMAGVIPHWLYFTALRTNQPLWYRIVVWTSAAACVLAILGLLLGVTQFRRSRPFRWASAIPYSGLMRWHYVTGVIFGVFTLTWAFSGLVSMEPFAWTNATGLQVPRDTFTGGATDFSQFPSVDAAAWDRVLNGRAVKEIGFTRIQDEHYYVVRYAADERREQRRERLHEPYDALVGRAEPGRLLLQAQTLSIRQSPFPVESLLSRLRAALPDQAVVDHELLREYDSYYYSRGNQAPLPVLRVRFNDPAQTWVYVDPATSQVVAEVHRLNRVERWLFNGLHSLDFAFLYRQRPLWDVVMIVLLLGSLTSSSIGLLLGFKRLRRGASQVAKSTSSSAAEPARELMQPTK